MILSHKHNNNNNNVRVYAIRVYGMLNSVYLFIYLVVLFIMEFILYI